MLNVLASDLKLGRYSWLMITLGFAISLGLAVAFRAGRARLAGVLARA